MLTQDQCDPNNPQQAFAWCFTAGVPDPRNQTQQGKNYRNQPMIPPQCYGVLSEMLWDFGLRWDESKQTAWVTPATGPMSNFSVGTITDEKPAVAATPDTSTDEMLAKAAAVVADQFPDKAAQLAQVTPDSHQAALATQANELLASVQRLAAARQQHEVQKAAAAAAATGGAAT